MGGVVCRVRILVEFCGFFGFGRLGFGLVVGFLDYGIYVMGRGFRVLVCV